jgi:hypothetical protein
MRKSIVKAAVFACASLTLLAFSQEAPLGSATTPTNDELKALSALKGTINGTIAWSTSRANTKHDI